MDGEKRRQHLIKCIKAYTKNHGYPPAVRDLVSMGGFATTSAVTYHLKILESRGEIRRTPLISRSIVVVEK